MLTVVNVVLVVLMYRSNELRRLTFGTTKLAATAAAQRNSTIILMCSAMLYSVTQFPFAVYSLLVVASSYPFCTHYFADSTAAMVFPVVVTIALINYSGEFFVYYSISKKFRTQFKTLPTKASRVVGLQGLKPAAAESSASQRSTATITADIMEKNGLTEKA